MPILDDLSSWLQRNFAGGNAGSAARTLINQATQPPDGSTPMSAMALAQPGARPLNPGEQPTPLEPSPMGKPGASRPGSNPFTPEWATQAGLNMMAAGAPAAPAPLLPPAPAHTPQQAPNLVETTFPGQPNTVDMAFPGQPAQITEQQRRLLRLPPSFYAHGN